MAAARNPARDSTGSCWRQLHQNSGKPCSINTSGASGTPVSATWNRAPLAATYRCRQGPGTSMTRPVSSGRVIASLSRLAALEDVLGLLSLVDRPLRCPHLLDLPETEVAEERGDEDVHDEHDEVAPREVQPSQVQQVGEGDGQHDDRQQTDEGSTREKAGAG